MVILKVISEDMKTLTMKNIIEKQGIENLINNSRTDFEFKFEKVFDEKSS